VVPHVGLASMRERATEIGGRIAIDSDPGGTRVRAWLPLPVVEAR
jgi:signal transduction histidine kinase